MKSKISLERIVCFLLAIGVCFVVDLSGWKVGNYRVQQYLIIIPSLFLLANCILLKKHKLNMFIMAIIGTCIAIFLLKSIKFGIDIEDVFSLFGFIIMPIMIIIFNNLEGKDYFIYYYVLTFSILELIAIIWLVKEDAILNVWELVRLRQVFYAWPNYFAMMSAIKFGLVMMLKKTNLKIKFTKVLAFLSVVSVFLSMSRTGIVMLFVVWISSKVENFKEKKKRLKFKKIICLLLAIVLFIVAAICAINSKDLSPGSTTEATIKGRIWRWEKTLEIAKENILLGTGFRSTVKFVGDIGSTHNDYVDILLKGGVVGFLVIYGFFINRMWVLYKTSNYEMAGIFLSILLGSFVQNPIKNISIMTILSMLISYSYSKSLAVNSG